MTDGWLVRGRCKATNLCDYCAKLAAVENAEMLSLAALEGLAVPEVWLVLTTSKPNPAREDCYRALEQLLRAIRGRWPGAEYASLLEFTTGYGPRSGGLRRPHWNVLLVGVPASAIGELRRLVEEIWCTRMAAKPRGQHVGQVEELGGLMRYVAMHFQKESQSPPQGWRGQRFNCSRGYFGERTRAEMRAAARESILVKREAWKLEQAGADVVQAVELAALEVAARAGQRWELVYVNPSTADAHPAIGRLSGEGVMPDEAPEAAESPGAAGARAPALPGRRRLAASG